MRTRDDVKNQCIVLTQRGVSSEVLKSWKRVPWATVESIREPSLFMRAPDVDTCVSFVAFTATKTAPKVHAPSRRITSAETPATRPR